MGLLVLYKNKSYFYNSKANCIIFYNLKKKCNPRKLVVLKVFKEETSKRFLELLETIKDKKEVLITPEDLEDQDLINLLRLYKIKYKVTFNISEVDYEELIKDAYRKFRELIRKPYRPFKSILSEEIPLVRIETLHRGFIPKAYYYDINSAYPSSFKLELPIRLSNSKDFCIYKIKIINPKDAIIPIKFKKHTYFIESSNSSLLIDKNTTILSEPFLKFYEEETSLKYKILEKECYETTIPYDVYHSLKILKDNNLPKPLINSIAYGYPLKLFKPMGIIVAQYTLLELVKRHFYNKGKILDFYVDAIISKEPLDFKNSNFTYKSKILENLYIFREGFLVSNIKTRFVSAILDYSYILETIKTSPKREIPKELLEIKDIKEINKLFFLKAPKLRKL